MPNPLSTLGEVIANLITQFFSAAWWADNLLNFIIFTVLVAFVVWLMQRWREGRRRRPYEGWYLRILGYDDDKQSIYWEEVQRFQNSRFELWKFCKSVVSGTVIVSLRTADKASEAGWLKVDTESREIVIDFELIPKEHIALWQQKPPPSALAADLYQERPAPIPKPAAL